MPRKHTTQAGTNVSAAEYAALSELAQQDGGIAPYLRRLIAEAAGRRGIEWPEETGGRGSYMKGKRGESQIRSALVRGGLMSEGEANAARIWRGWNVGEQKSGWHVEPFGRSAWHAGRTIEDAIDYIESVAEARK